jgi:hypothetical protein
MAYEKLYNEIYAAVTLKYFWREYRPGFVKCESPDWFNESTGFGLEVSQALVPSDGITESFLEKYLGKLREEIPEVELERYGGRLYFYNDRLWAVMPEEDLPCREKALYRFGKKLEKLNANYRSEGENGLYLFLHDDRVTREECAEWFREMRLRQVGCRRVFRRVFLDGEQVLYVLDFVSGALEVVPIPERARIFLAAETERLRQRGDWPEGQTVDEALEMA